VYLDTFTETVSSKLQMRSRNRIAVIKSGLKFGIVFRWELISIEELETVLDVVCT
jgi:hypothetical protein